MVMAARGLVIVARAPQSAMRAAWMILLLTLHAVSTCAVSATGIGEQFIRHTVAHDISALVEYAGLTVQQAAEKVIREKLQPGDGGVIAVGKDGSIALVFNSEGMYRGAADSSGRFEVKIWE